MIETPKIDDGGPAFPWGEHGTHLGGMTLRDYFAAQSLATFARDMDDPVIVTTFEDVAFNAYKLADAMLAARSNPQGEQE